MKIDLPDGKFVTIDWMHLRRPATEFRPLKNILGINLVDTDNSPLYKLVNVAKTKGGATVCTMNFFETGNAEPIALAEGKVKCDKKDNYSKFQGRKKSLTLALETVPFSALAKEDRNIIWNKILNVKGNKAKKRLPVAQ